VRGGGGGGEGTLSTAAPLAGAGGHIWWTWWVVESSPGAASLEHRWGSDLPRVSGQGVAGVWDRSTFSCAQLLTVP
jgi:hypothetical protein